MSVEIPLVCKTTSEDLNYTFDFRGVAFVFDDPIASASVTQLSGSGSLTIGTPAVSSDGTQVSVAISAGSAGVTYRVRCLATTTAGRDIAGLVDLKVVSET